jgi:hypothetical protein
MSRSDPFIIALGESLPFDQILEHLTLAEVLMIDNFFDLLFFLSIDYVGQRPGEVRPVTNGFFVRGKKGCVEDIVYLPVIRQL